jgi:hypothetical protein
VIQCAHCGHPITGEQNGADLADAAQIELPFSISGGIRYV